MADDELSIDEAVKAIVQVNLAHYYEGAARDMLANPKLPRVIEAMNDRSDDRLSLRNLRELYDSDEAPAFQVHDGFREDLAAISLMIADAARSARVGASADELFAGPLDDTKARRLLDIEAEFRETIANAPVEELVAGMRAKAGVKPARKP